MTDRRVLVVDYDSDWPRRAGMVVDTLAALGDRAHRIEHIGSTSIPGMASKNVLDLQVSTEDLAAAVDAFDSPLRALGFELTGYERDHVPTGCNDDPSLWSKRLWSRRGSVLGDGVNLHVRRVGAPNERLALLFRDWFRAHPGSVPAYAAFKRALADQVDDTGVYADVKDPMVDLVITIAETWARDTSWTP